ncbi:InlB B-repeat-containing protein [Acetivibrio straminisolvens]|jgi:uncharacterized repeat protein (TIGR02543 family)|nr:InlB B-repeat-containing protein [Acetivibrio straminisolvens]
MGKRFISIFLLVAMLFTMLPAGAMSAATDNVSTSVNTEWQKRIENPFADVKEGSWYYDAVQYSFINGFFSGTGENTFSPDGTMTRAMFVTVLGRMAGVDQTKYKEQSSFGDVPKDAYYAPYVEWAFKHGITAGVGNGKFDPNGLVTREQMAVFFVRYFENFGVDYDTGADITTVPADLDTVAPWAREAVLKLWNTGILAGDGTNFNPKGNASRAQAAALCMSTDKAVETWYSEPGVPSDRVSVDPNNGQSTETPDSSTGDSGNDDNEKDSDTGKNTVGSQNQNKTTYYKVTFVIDSTKEEKVYKKDTLLSTLSIPTMPSGKVFLGWYYDEEKTKPVNGNDKLNANLTLYAHLTDAIALDEGGTPNFVSALDQKADFSVSVKKTGGAPIPGTDFKFRNITAPEKTPEESVPEEDLANIENIKVVNNNGVWTISAANGGFTAGHTYQIELLNDDVIYDDSVDAFDTLKAMGDGYDITKIRFFNFSIEKNGTMNLKLNGGIKYIPVGDLNEADGLSLMDYAGLYLASTDEQGNTTYTASNGSGSFTYNGSEDIQVGDTVAVYSGTKPTERKPQKGTQNKTDNGEVAYVKITDIDDSTYYYVEAEAEDVLFTPDVLPVDVDEDDGTSGWEMNGTSVIIQNSKLIFSDAKYESVGLSSNTTVDVGDFLAFFTGEFGEAGAQDLAYGVITAIKVNGDGTTTVTYKEVDQDQIMAAMDLYDETKVSEAELEGAIEENKGEIQEIIEAQLMESDFFDEAGEYLAEVALKTAEVREIFGDDLTLSDCDITYADGTPLGANELMLMGNIIDKEQDGKKPKFSVSISTKTVHFDPKIVGSGIRAEVAVNYKFKIQKKGSNNVLEVDLTAFFEQEFTFGFNVSGGAVWKWKWIIPYIADYRMTGNLDLGTYTGIGITATAKLNEAKEPWGMPWPNSAREAAATKKIFSLSQSIKQLVDDVEKLLPEEEGTASGGLAEKYSRFMEDANEEWVDLVSANLLDLRSAVDPLHVLAFGLQVDFVVSANLNVALGMTFQYENFKRHSFTLLLLSKKGESETIDLSTNGYQFDLYVMGTIGIRAGVRVKVTVGLFSTKLAGIGLQFETGAYARMWGYFYYHLENWKVNGTWQKNSSYSGALLVEIGAYLDVKFIAEALNGKYSYTPSIFTKEWPLWSAGQRENVYDFAYEEDPTFNILNVNTYTIPKTVFDMNWMDIKTGETEEGFKNKTKNYDSNTAHNGDDEAYFAVDLTNPAFKYNPVNNQITVNTSSGEVTQSGEMKITWKGVPLSKSSETLSRTIKLNWSNEANAGTIAFDSNGGSAVPMLRLLVGTALSGKMPASPTRVGYTFAGWYADKALTNSFTATTMPKGNTTLYAKWTPSTVNYTVEHYQKALDGQYVLIETDKSQTGKVGEQTTAVAKNYTGFTAQAVKQQTIAADGSTFVAIYYDRNLYDLKFVYGNGSNDIVLKVPYGSAIVKPFDPTKEGYNFAGWNVAIPDVMPANALTFTANWTEKTDTPYIVKHFKQNLNGTYTLEQTEGKTGVTGELTNAAPRTYTGFTPQSFTQETILANGSTVVEIYYKRNINSLSWNVNGGNPLTGTFTQGNVMYGTPIDKPTTPTRTGYTFAGWYKDAGLTSALEENATMPDTDLTLTAKWNVNQYTITFNSNGGSAVAAITKDYGSVVTAPAQPTREGYNFAGWKLNGVEYTFTTMPAENITLIADWAVISNIPYKVEHYLEELDGSYPVTPNDTENLTGSNGATVTASPKGITGFTYDPGVSGTISSGAIALDGSLVLRLYYKRNSYNVTWNGNGGSVNTAGATTGSVKYGTTIYSPTNEPTKTGYTFNGWSGYAENMTMPAGNVTFTANWTINQYTITFDSNGGSDVANITQDYGTVVNAPTPPTKEGFKFAGWQLNGVDYTFTTMPAEHIELVVVWSDMQSYKVNFDANGGTVETSYKYVNEGETYGELPVPTNDDQFFLGWYTAKIGGTKVTSNTVVELTADQTLYACWADTGFTGEVSEEIELYVAGIRVTTENMNDILGDGSGSVQFDPSTMTTNINGYLYNVGTLHLNDAIISGYYSKNTYGTIINATIYCSKGLTIANKGFSIVENTFSDTNANVYGVTGVWAEYELVIEGTGTLTFNSGAGGSGFNSGIFAGSSGDYLHINGPTVKAFGGIAKAGGKSYGVLAANTSYIYAVKLKKGTLEAHGYDVAVFSAPEREGEVNYVITNGSYYGDYIIETIIGSTNYDGSEADYILYYEYRNYKYIYVENP